MKKKSNIKRKSLMAKKARAPKNLTGIALLTSKAYKMGFQALAESISKRTLRFTMVEGAGCFTGVSGKLPIMNIDLKMFENDAFDTSHYHIVAKGAILHEAGHLLYTDFNIVHENVNYSKKCKEEVSKLGSDWYKETDNDKKDEIFSELKDKMVEYVYAANMPRTLNALEDGSIEASMSERSKEESGCICFLRDILYEKYQKSKTELIDNQLIPIEEDEWNDITMESIIMEVCYLATLNYRKKTDITIIEALFTKDEVEEFKQLGLYARFSAKTTDDRKNVARIILDKCKPILQKIAEKLAEAYIYNIDNAEDMMNNMQNNANKYANNSSGTPNPSGSGTSSGSGSSGLPSSQPQPQSKYDLSLPEELQKKLNTPTAGDGSEESDDSDSDSEGEEKEMGEEESSKNRISPPSQEEASQDAINNMNEVIRNAKKTHQKQEEQEQVDNIMNHPNIRAGEGECHSSTGLTILDDDDLCLRKVSYEGKISKNIIEKRNLLPKVNDLSKKIKKVLMHRNQDEISKGRYEGKVDTGGLYRIKTDLQVFKKESQGEKTKVRFAILVDESGSMNGSGLAYAITGCWMIAKAAQKLKIPFSVLGHYDYDGVQVEKYIDYKDSTKKAVLDNLFKMHSGGCNRDGLAIYHSLRELVGHAKPEEQLYFIILSDGQPSSSGYSGQAAINDIRSIIKTYEKYWNVHSIGVGIGDDFDYEDTVGKIYENAVVVAKPEDLPNEMFKIFKKIVKA